jgi:hypothetical protein
MADEPADVDPREFTPDSDPTRLDAAPFIEAIEDAAAPTAVLDGQTTPHPLLDSAEFRAGLEVGRAEGYRAGHAAGVLEGRADIRAEDLQAGRELGYDDFRRALIASGTDPVVAMIERDKLRAYARKYPPAAAPDLSAK